MINIYLKSDETEYIKGRFINLTKVGTTEIPPKEGEQMPLFTMVKDINSRRYGKCYKIIPKWKVTANSRYEYKVIMNSKALKQQDLPKVAQIFITSKVNAYGIVDTLWFEGQEIVIKRIFGDATMSFINLSLNQHKLLSNCSTISKFQCMTELAMKGIHF